MQIVMTVRCVQDAGESRADWMREYHAFRYMMELARERGGFGTPVDTLTFRWLLQAVHGPRTEDGGDEWAARALTDASPGGSDAPRWWI
jgi:hypothetical protein